MIIGGDLDGTITILPMNNTKSRLPWFFGLCLVFVPPNRKMVAILQKREAAGDRIIIVSSRAEKLEQMTRWQLRMLRVPFSGLFLVGVGGNAVEKKLSVIIQEGINYYVDDNHDLREGLKKRGFETVYSPQEFIDTEGRL